MFNVGLHRPVSRGRGGPCYFYFYFYFCLLVTGQGNGALPLPSQTLFLSTPHWRRCIRPTTPGINLYQLGKRAFLWKAACADTLRGVRFRLESEWASEDSNVCLRCRISPHARASNLLRAGYPPITMQPTTGNLGSRSHSPAPHEQSRSRFPFGV